MNASRSSKKLSTTLAFRHLMARREMLEAIQREKGHRQLSDTLRDCVDEYIAAYLRSDKRGPQEAA